MDVLDQKQRSYNMSRIKSRDTKPELILRKALWDEGLRYRIKNKLPGKPDVVFRKKKIAIFVDGCFWHKCPKHFKLPKTRTDFWRDKIQSNVDRDKKSVKELEVAGWYVLRFWEHEIANNLEQVMSKISNAYHVLNE